MEAGVTRRTGNRADGGNEARPGSRSAADTQSAAAQSGKVGVVTTEQIVKAAVRICDERGLEFLTIRRLAEDLDIGAMTLYIYFRGKDEILDGIADHVLGNLQIPPMTDPTPAGMARNVAVAIFAMMREHPSVVHLLSSRTTMSERSLEVAMDHVIGLLRDAGFSDEGSVRAYALIMTYCLGFASYQMPRDWGRDNVEGVEELRRRKRYFYASLPLPQCANLVELSAVVTTMPSDDQFIFGLDCLIAGLTVQPGVVGARSSSPA
jgi:AcrR family transcriptional regulator